MTDFIDLATLAGLGQHFSSHQDVAELKESLGQVQNDLALIKGFLLRQYGSEFSDALNNDENSEQKTQGKSRKLAPVVETFKAGSRISGSKNTITEEGQHGPQQLQRPRPPPLQRFSRVTSSDEGTSLVGRNVTNIRNANAATPTTNTKSEKFHRNFLSISNLKGNRSTPGGSGSLKRGVALLDSVNSGPVKEELEDCISGRAVSVYKMPRLRTSALHKVEATYDNEVDNEDDEYNVSEDAYAAVEVTEDGNFDETGEEELGYAYEDGGDYQEGDYDDTMSYQDQDEDGTSYEDEYSVEGLQEFIDVSGSATDLSRNKSLSVQLINSRRSTNGTMKKAQQRRLSLPAPNNGGRMADTNFASGSGSGDTFLKKCKVCHEEVPSYSLFNHVVSAHYKGEVPTCTICKKTFTYKQGLISHMRYHDAEKYDKACSFCGKKFIRRSDVIIHERRLHTGERPFTCPVPDCNQGFVRRYCLLTHIKTNHGEPYISQVAGDRKD